MKKIILSSKKRWEELSLRIKSAIIVLLIVLVSFFVPGLLRETTSSSLHPAQLYFLNASPVAVGEIFPVELRVKTSGTSINAMGFTIVFNPTYLQVMSMTTDTSFCTFYLDNTYDNTAGTVSLSCGVPQPGFAGDSLAVHLTMRGLVPGDPALEVDPKTENLLANNGKGSNIVEGSPKLTLDIQQL